jgi:short-subunit dehydrogenase
VYAATKAFVLSFGEALSNELEEFGVTVTVLMPGATDTDFFHKSGGDRSKIYAESQLADPADVARDGYEALMAGKDVVVSGFRNKVQALMADVSPHAVIVAKARATAEPTEKPASEIRRHATHGPSLRERAALERRLTS